MPSLDSLTRIETLFHAPDAFEFIPPDRNPFFHVIPITRRDARATIVYSTKPYTAAQLLAPDGLPEWCGIVGRMGLPAREEVDFLATLMRGCRCVFLGDLDPPDLLIWWYLRCLLPERDIRWIGVSDSLLSSVALEIGPTCAIRLPAEEQAAMMEVEQLLPNLDELAGPSCAELLRSGHKLECEALVTGGQRLGSIEGALGQLGC